MSKHTKGPWKVYATPNDVDFLHEVNGVASIYISDYSEAKARLIEAAPELLDALKLCYDHCRLYYPEVEHNNVGKSVRAAIEKAEGDQQ